MIFGGLRALRFEDAERFDCWTVAIIGSGFAEEHFLIWDTATALHDGRGAPKIVGRCEKLPKCECRKINM